MRKAAIFDFDFTFVNANSTARFIKFYLFTHGRIFKLLRYYAVMILANIGWYHFTGGGARERLIACLRGEKEAHLVETARRYASGKLRRAVNDEMRQRFNELKEKGYYTILVSSSLDCVVEAFGRSYGFDDLHASELAYDDRHIFRGFLKKDLTGRKEGVLEGVDFRNSFFFTDNFEDLPLARKVGNSFAVVQHASQERFWRQHRVPVVWVRPKTILPRPLLAVPSFYFLNFRINLRAFLFSYGGFLILSFLFFKHPLGLSDWWLLFLSWLGFTALYEIGYLVNDCYSVRREDGPSLRVDGETCERLPGLILARLFVFALLIGYFSVIGIPSAFIVLYLLGNIVMTASFAVHNFMRQPKRIWTYPLLSLSHFVVPLLLFKANFLYAFMAAIVFHVPWVTLSYIRRVRGVEAMNGRHELHFVALPKAILLLMSVVLFSFQLLPSGFVVIGLLLSVVDLGKGMKTLT